jgi:hypothetical protein
MTDLASLAAVHDGPRHQECTVHYALRTLPGDQCDYLRAALDNAARRVIRNSDIARALDALGVPASGNTVGRHVAGLCRCGDCDCGCRT